jgi:hypothetical protein
MPTIPKQGADRKTRVFNLTQERLEALTEKKEAAKLHSENVKRIDEEIKAVMDEEDADTASAQKEA